MRIIWRDKQIVLAISLYVTCGALNTFCKGLSFVFHTIQAFTFWFFAAETNPLFFVASPEHGGLGFGSTASGVMIGVTGISTIAFQLLFYKRISAAIGLVNSFRAGLAVFALVTLLIPVSHVFAGQSAALWSYLILVFAAQTCASQMLFSSVFALISNSCEKQFMGRANGISQSLVALFRALGPPAAGNSFAWSVAEPGSSFPRNVYFNYGLQLAAFGLVLVLSLGLSRALNRPRDEQPAETLPLPHAADSELET